VNFSNLLFLLKIFLISREDIVKLDHGIESNGFKAGISILALSVLPFLADKLLEIY